MPPFWVDQQGNPVPEGTPGAIPFYGLPGLGSLGGTAFERGNRLNADYHANFGEDEDYATQVANQMITRWAQGQGGVDPNTPTSADPGRADFDRRIGQATNYNAQNGIAIVNSAYGPQQVPMTRAVAERAGLPWQSNSSFSVNGGGGASSSAPGSASAAPTTAPTTASTSSPFGTGGFDLGGTGFNINGTASGVTQTGGFSLNGGLQAAANGSTATGFTSLGTPLLTAAPAATPTWYQVALEAAQQYYEPVAAAASAFGGGGGGGQGGGGGNGGALTGQPAPPPVDYTQSPQYQQGLQNLLSVLGIGGSPMTWSGFNGAR